MRTVTAAPAVMALAGVMSLACDNTAKDQVGHGAAGKPSTLTGCLTSGDNGRSILLRAENPAQPQGNERPERPSSSPDVYRVESDRTDTLDISRHVNSRVTVTGYVHAVPAHATGDADGTLQRPPTSGANTKPQDDRTDVIDMQIVRVTAVQPLGACG
jgi:hypothetical protein